MSSGSFNLPDRSGSGPYLEAALQKRNETLENTLRAERAAFAQRETELLAKIEGLKLDHEHCAVDYEALDGCTKELREGKKNAMATIAELNEKLTEANRRAEAGETAREELAKLKAEKEGAKAMIQIVVHARYVNNAQPNTTFSILT